MVDVSGTCRLREIVCGEWGQDEAGRRPVWVMGAVPYLKYVVPIFRRSHGVKINGSISPVW